MAGDPIATGSSTASRGPMGISLEYPPPPPQRRQRASD
jgi:hypothetical protein